MSEKDATELYRRHRPAKFSEVIGQKAAVRTLVDLWKQKRVPHCLLFSGPSGVGKTTLARILRTRLKCHDSDYQEVNAASERGIDLVRDIRRRMPMAAMGGGCRVWVIDECHRLTGDAQSAFLKMLEDTPKHVYFMLCTTDPQKLLPTIRTRAHEVRLEALSPSEVSELVVSVISKEGKEITEEVLDKLIEAADGSARKALVLLHSILGEEDEEKQLEAIVKGDVRRQAIDIARALISPGTRWQKVAKVLKEIEGLEEQAESVRRMVLGYMTQVALGDGRQASRACEIIDAFRDNLYDCGKAGLVAACYEAVSGGK